MRVLLPKIQKPAAEHVDVIASLQESWTPQPQHLRPKSFPTPFAQSEMMAHVLGLLKLESGGRPEDVTRVNPDLQQSYERWELMLLGITLGELNIETVDLRQPTYDNFGRMLGDLREECRFMTLIRDLRTAGPRGTALLVGGTDPECLFWCSPRIPTYWNTLKTRISGHALAPDARALLAEWRAVLQRNSAWNLESGPVWQKALHVALDGTALTNSTSKLSRDSGFLGPVLLEVPRRQEQGEREHLALYLPVLSKGWGARFQDLLFLKPIERRPGVVTLEDTATQRVIARIAKSIGAARGETASSDPASAVSSERYEFLAGVGSIDVDTGTAVHQGQMHWLEDHAGQPGYRSLVVAPLLESASRSLRRAVTDADVRAFPTLFPDALRLVLGPQAETSEDEVRVQLSRHVTSRRAAGIALPQTGLPPEAWKPNAALPNILAIPGNNGAPSAGLVEQYGPTDTPQSVGEIRALGLTLWLFYLGECEIRADRGLIVWSADEGQELFGAVRSPDGQGTSLEVWPHGLRLANEPSERARARDKRATLQRFLVTWQRKGQGEDSDPRVLGERIGAIAALTFVQWVMGGDSTELPPFGPFTRRVPELFALNESCALPMFVDDYARE
ncbi:MAG: hypothetical protein Q8Q09_22130 [Deltaproteobacteria bacterium]|nr:hypothetical protein [Deltaproteobacteria bacterium]